MGINIIVLVKKFDGSINFKLIWDKVIIITPIKKILRAWNLIKLFDLGSNIKLAAINEMIIV